MNASSSSESVAVLMEKLKGQRTCMFTTLDAGGQLNSHPMTKLDLDRDGYLWFFTSRQTALSHDIDRNPEANLGFSEPDDSLFVSVSGRAWHEDDRARMKELWNPFAAAWFPRGLDDPDLTLLKFSPRSAEYWDSNSSRMVQMFRMVKASLTGNVPEVKPEEHGKLSL